MNSTIDGFNPKRYTGKWWELAKYETVEYKCVRAYANYTLNKDGTSINVTNTCILEDNSEYKIYGIAKINPYCSGKLVLSLAGSPLESYWIHWTDYERYSIVGGPSGKYLWILSREKQIPSSDIPWLLKLVEMYGYDTTNIMANPLSVLNNTEDI